LEDASSEENCKAHVSVGEERTCMHLHALD